MLQSVGVMAARARRVGRVPASVLLAAAVAGCATRTTVDARPMAGTASLSAQPSATLVSREPCYVERVDGKDTSTVMVGAGVERSVIVSPGIHTVQVWYSDGRKYSRVRAEVGLVVIAGHKYHAEQWPPVFYDDTTNQRAQQSLRGAIR